MVVPGYLVGTGRRTPRGGFGRQHGICQIHVAEYEMLRAGASYTANGVMFADCIEVNQNDDDDKIVRTDIRKEVYARDVGLIAREIRILNYCTAGCIEFGEIESGVEYVQTIKSYGIR